MTPCYTLLLYACTEINYRACSPDVTHTMQFGIPHFSGIPLLRRQVKFVHYTIWSIPWIFILLPLLPGQHRKSRDCPRNIGRVGMYVRSWLSLKHSVRTHCLILYHRVDDVVKSLYPPLDPILIEARSVAFAWFILICTQCTVSQSIPQQSVVDTNGCISFCLVSCLLYSDGLCNVHTGYAW